MNLHTNQTRNSVIEKLKRFKSPLMTLCECQQEAHSTGRGLPWQSVYPQKFSELSWGQLANHGHRNAGCTDQQAWPSKGQRCKAELSHEGLVHQ